MSKPPEPRPKRGYKGLENFFKRISYNLGNSPSQTEIKIISCIPIDVTDLQERIVILEKQLDDAYKGTQSANKDEKKGKKASGGGGGGGKGSKKSVEARPVTISTGFLQNFYPEPPYDLDQLPSNPTEIESRCGCNPGGYSSACGCTNKGYCSDKKGKSCCSSVRNKSTESLLMCERLTPKVSRDIIKDDIIEMNNEIRANKNYKKQMTKKIKKLKEHFVYYAHTEASPFTNTSPKVSSEPKCNLFSDDYINDILKRQYCPKVILDEFSETSQFSSPICRDVNPICSQRQTNNLQCTSSLGEFQNLDNHLPKLYNVEPLSIFATNVRAGQQTNINRYDDDGYDKIPVREKSKKIDENKNDVHDLEILCWPEISRPVRKIRPHIYQYHKYNAAGKVLPVVKSSRKKKKIPKPCNVRHQSTCMETARSCHFECGNVYKRDLYPKQDKIVYPRTPINHVMKKKLMESSAMTEQKSTECQTITTTSVELDTNSEYFQTENKEQTLDQIKNILQTVLTEVKTNVQTIYEKKDAVIQKDPSINMEACSTLLNSITYSYNNNPYISQDATSYSQQLKSHANCITPATYPQIRFVHPLLIQNSQRIPCTNSFKPSAYPQHKPLKPIITAATNTQDTEQKSETRKLIKEIYKSMALHMELPCKDDSATECSSPKITADAGQTSFKSNLDSEYRQNIVSTLTVNTNKRDRKEISIQENMSSSVQTSTDEEASKTVTNTTATRTNLIQKSTVTNTARTFVNTDTKTSDVNIGDTESESEESDRTTTVDVKADKPKKKESKGLFSKMKAMFRSKNKDKQKPQKQKEIKKKKEDKKKKYIQEEEEASDSDDYQTIYSHKIERKPRPRRVEKQRAIKPRIHSKVRYSRHSYHRHPERFSRTSHIEQEHLRHWNDKVNFQGDRRHSSERRTIQRMEQPRGYYGDIRYSQERPMLRHEDGYRPEDGYSSNRTDSRWSSDRPSSRPNDRSRYNHHTDPPTPKPTYIHNEELMAPRYQPGIHFRHATNRGQNVPRVSKYVRANGYQPIVRKVIMARSPEPSKNKTGMASWLSGKKKTSASKRWN